MPSIPWSSQINFTSALLLHSCTTILLKETLNTLEITRRVIIRRRHAGTDPRAHGIVSATGTSVVLDAYTSILSNDVDGELSELYYTNTGVALLGISLASSVAMNLLLSDLTLNMIIAGTFGLTFVISLACGRAKYTLPLMALRRAGRFIWSDTPFVNFFSLIYIATVLKGQSILRLQDYIAFRSIAVLEAILMKAKIASADRETQVSQMRKLIGSERVILSADQKAQPTPDSQSPMISRADIKAFSTQQRLSVMFLKTTIGHEYGRSASFSCPAKLPLPAVGVAVEDSTLAWKLCRMSEDVMVLADCLAETNKADDTRSQIRSKMHGILLRRLGKKRAVYLIRGSQHHDSEREEEARSWHSNVNMVTGVDAAWLTDAFVRGQTSRTCVVTGIT